MTEADHTNFSFTSPKQPMKQRELSISVWNPISAILEKLQDNPSEMTGASEIIVAEILGDVKSLLQCPGGQWVGSFSNQGGVVPYTPWL